MFLTCLCVTHRNGPLLFFFFFNLFTYLFTFGCSGHSLPRAGTPPPQPRRVGATLRRSARASQRLRWPLPLRSMGSRHTGFSSCGSQALERRLNSCGTRARSLRSMWDPPGPGIEPLSPALAGRLSTTALPGKSLVHCFVDLFPTSQLFPNCAAQLPQNSGHTRK